MTSQAFYLSNIFLLKFSWHSSPVTFLFYNKTRVIGPLIPITADNGLFSRTLKNSYLHHRLCCNGIPFVVDFPPFSWKSFYLGFAILV